MDADDRGEVNLLLRDIKSMSEEIMHDLMDVDNKLEKLQEKAINGMLNIPEVLEEIKSVRVMIGSMEREETQELRAEDITQSLLKKLSDLIDKCLA